MTRLYRSEVPAIRAVTATAREVTYEPIESTDGLLSVVHNVDICAVGIEYPLASGPKTFTPEDLVQAVASQSDPAIHAPRVWLGHEDDDRFHKGRATAAGSAEPALGKVDNMRVEDEGMTLVGDIVGCPTWLAKILSSAYPSRSIEGLVEAKTVTGHDWGLVVTDLALLGVVWPGVSTLDDLEALYSEDGPEGIEVKEETMAVAASRAVTAQVNIDDVRRAFYNALPEMDISSWSWIRAMQVDPMELIVDDDEGDLWAVTVDFSGEEISFGDPVKKKIEYVNASQAKDPDARGLIVRALTAGTKVAASWDKRTESRPDSTSQENGMTPEQIKLLRGRLGLSEEQLPDDATPEQITAALGGSGNPSPPAVPETTPPASDPGATQVPPDTTRDNPSPDQVPDNPDPLQPNAVAASAAALPEGYVAVPVDQWKQVQVNAAAGAKVAVESEEHRQGAIIAKAVDKGRISPAQKDNFVLMFKRDPAGAEKLLTASVEGGGLMEGTIPVTARGIDPSATDATTTEAYPSEWLPELQSSGAPSPVTMEA